MALAAGRLRHRILIQRQIQTRVPETGDVRIIWQDLPGGNDGKIAADVHHLSVNEIIAGQSMQSRVIARITIRHSEGLDASMRILFRGKIYNPQGWLPDPESGLEYLTAPCTEGVNDGR